MATIIEVQNSKMEHISECAEKVMHYGKKLMECIEEVNSHGYAERYGHPDKYGGYSERYGRREDYPRYY